MRQRKPHGTRVAHINEYDDDTGDNRDYMVNGPDKNNQTGEE